MSEVFWKRAIEGTFWAYVQNWAGRGVSLVVFFILARLLTPLDFGTFAIALVLLALAELLVEQGFAHAIVQRTDIDERHLSSAFWATLIVGLVLACVALVVAGGLAAAFDQPRIVPLVHALSPVFILMALSSVPAALLRREINYKVLAKRTTLSNLVSGVVAIWFAALGAGVWTFVAQQLAYQLVGVAVLWRYEPWRPSMAISLPHLKQLAGFSGKVTLGKLLEFVEARAVDIVVGRSLGMVALGNYSLAFKANQAITQVLAAPLWDSATGIFSRLQLNQQATRAAYLGLSNFSSIAIIPVFLFLAAAAPGLIPTLLGTQWEPSVPAFQVLAVLGAVRALAFLNGSLLQANGMATATLMLAGFRVALSLVCLTVLIRFGVFGAALALLLGQLLVVPMSFRISKIKHGIGTGVVIRSLYKPLLATVAAIAASITIGWHFATGSASTIAVMLSAVIWLVVYLLILVLIMPRTLVGYTRGLPDAVYGWVLLLSGVAIHLQERVELAAFDWYTRILSAHARQQSKEHTIRQVLVVPPDFVDIRNSLGDQALLGGLISGLEKRGVQRMLVMCQHGEALPAWPGMEIQALGVWRRWFALPTVIREMRNSVEVVIIGADTLDGFYSRFESLIRYAIARMACRLGTHCVVVSSSFNNQPDPATVAALQHLSDEVVLCARDPVSAGRIAKASGKKPVYAADLGFLLEPDMHCRLDREVQQWCESQRHALRPVIGWNMSPHSLQLLRPAQRDAMVTACSRSIRRLWQSYDASIILIPHDFRSSGGDQDLLIRVESELADLPNGLLLRLNGPYSAREIKAACRHLDFLFTGRMHLMIAAFGMGVPAVAVDYQGKFAGLVQYFGLSADNLISPEETCHEETLYSFVARGFIDRATIQAQVRMALPDVAAKAELNFSKLR